jgi:uncharacterized protein (DUF885 family)
MAISSPDALRQTPGNAAEAALATIIAEHEKLDRQADPVSAVQEGDRGALRRLPDVRLETEQAHRQQLIAIGERLAGIDPGGLSPESALNHAFLSRLVGLSVEEAGFDFARIAFENDSGFHWLGWDIERARACFTDNSALAAHNIQTELERYISWPAQALAYKVGELRFRALRREAEQALGERFSVREFHDLLLLGGPLPMDVVETRVRAWIEGRRR